MRAGAPDLSKGHRSVAALAVACLLISGVTVGVRAAYGAFDDTMTVTGTFARAGQLLKPGSDVLYRGVPVGEVRSIELVGQRVRITLALEPDARVPTDVEAVVAPKTLFGEKSVELRGGRGAEGPFLEDGSRLARTRAGAEVEDLIAAAEPLLRDIDTTELASLTTELTQALQGQGRRINRALGPTVAAAGLLEDTIDAQLRLLDSSARLAAEVRSIGPGLNATARNLNLLLPTLNQARADFVRLFRTVGPLADNLSEILVTVRPDLERVLEHGGNVTRVLIAREDELAATVSGLATYFQAFADGLTEGTFPDGSKAAYFKTFIHLDDIGALLCAVLNPPVPVPDEMLAVLGTVGDALLEESGLIDCAARPGSDTADAPTVAERAQPYWSATGAPDASAPAGLAPLVEGAAGGEGP